MGRDFLLLMPYMNGRTEPRLDTLQSIELAEGVEIRLRTAGPYVRLLAYLLDLLIRAGISIAAYLLLLLAGIIIGFNVAQGVGMLVTFGLTFFYYIIFEAGKRGASPVSYTHLTLPTKA